MGRLLWCFAFWLTTLATHLSPAADPPKPAAVVVPAGPRLDTPPWPTTWVGFSPDGRTLYARYEFRHFDGRKPDELVAWAVSGWAEQRRWSVPATRRGFEDHPNRCVATPDGRVVAVTADGLVVASPAADAPAQVTPQGWGRVR